jgi:flavodoxin
MRNKEFFKIFALVLGCVTVFAACDRENSNTDDDLISAQIIARICEANVKLFAENEITVTQRQKDYDILGTGLWIEGKKEVNLSAKKSLEILKWGDVTNYFHYYDETAYYQFYGATETEPESFLSAKISTGYWKYYSWDLPYMSDTMVKTIGKWREENGQLVVDNPTTNIEEYAGSKYCITLSENNKYLKYELKSVTGENLATFEYFYTANPVFPARYQPGQFPAIKQYSVNVNWGGNYGTDTYYTGDLWANEDLKYFSISRMGNWGETPNVEGKMPLFYYDEARTQLILDDWEKTNFYVDYDYSEGEGYYYWFFSGDLSSETDGTTVYVWWEDAETIYNQYGNK